MADPQQPVGGKRALGRGLEALLPGGPTTDGAARNFLKLPIERLRPMTGGQPRRSFDERKLEELAESIREHGVLQPLLVRPVPGGYEIIAGERRWRAAQRAGLLEVPVLIRDRTAGDEAFELALVENLQRDDLNAIETALGYRRLIDDFSYTQDKLAKRVGKDRSTVANALRLLKLPEKVQARVAEGALSEGHARALLAIEDSGALVAASERVIRGGLSVRQTEALARRIAAAEKAAKGAKPTARESPAVRDLVERLQRALGTRVTLVHRGGKGRLEIHFGNLDDLDRIIEQIL